MEFWYIHFLISLLNLDTTSFFQSSISRPSVVGLICGTILGYPFEGFICGMLIEFVILDFPPIGGMPVPNGCIGAGVCSILIPKYGVYFSFFGGIVVSIIYSYLERQIRSMRNIMNLWIDKSIEKLDFNFGKYIFFSIFLELFIGFLYVSISFIIINYLYNFVYNKSFSYYLNEVMKLSFISVIFVVFSSLFFKFLNQVKKNA
ncbi:MAG: PTS sugar transporter subunit IIC [Elusimicrobiales bacterium]|nr:PTS sugar transporter subunit IIC [Elusimicrobiales bacterium]